MTIADDKIGEVGKRINLISVVVNHLPREDEGRQRPRRSIHVLTAGVVFPFALEAFETVLQLHGSDIWKKTPPMLPKMALDAIKENKVFLSVSSYKNGAEARTLGWLEPFLKSVMPLASYCEIVHLVFQIFLEQLQHESMRNIRPITLAYFFSVRVDSHALVFITKRQCQGHQSNRWSTSRQ